MGRRIFFLSSSGIMVGETKNDLVISCSEFHMFAYNRHKQNQGNSNRELRGKQHVTVSFSKLVLRKEHVIISLKLLV